MDEITQEDTKNWVAQFEPKSPEVRKAYRDWLSTPTEKRQLKTKQAFAEAHDVHPDTLRSWEGDPNFADEVRISLRQGALMQSADVIDHVKKRALGKASEGSARHAEIYLENVAGFGKRQEIGVTTRQEKNNAMDVLTSGRLSEQLDGIIAHLHRKEQAVEAEFTVVRDNESPQDGAQG